MERSAESGEATFTRAELRATTRGTAYKNPVVIAGPELEAWLAYFPGVGTGRKSDFNPFCGVGYKLDLYQVDGGIHTITMDGGLRYWSEGRGHWFLDEGFHDFATGRLKDANPNAS